MKINKIQKQKIKHEVVKSFLPRITLWFGVGCLSSFTYIKNMQHLIKSNFFEVSSEPKKYPIEVEIAVVFILLGVLLILISSLMFLDRSEKNKVYLIYLLLPLLVLLFVFSFNLARNELNWVWWIACTLIWIFSVCFLCEVIFSLFRILFEKYNKLDSKDQFTIGISVFTFILGLLLAK